MRCLVHQELAWLFHEPHTGLDDCLNMLPSCFITMMSVTIPLSSAHKPQTTPIQYDAIELQLIFASKAAFPGKILLGHPAHACRPTDHSKVPIFYDATAAEMTMKNVSRTFWREA